MSTCNGWNEQPHTAKRVTFVCDGDELYLCDNCLTDYRAEVPLEHPPTKENLIAEVQAHIRNMASVIHEIEAGHDTENVRGCTHYNCKSAMRIALVIKNSKGSGATQ